MFNMEDLRDFNATSVQEVIAMNDIEKLKDYATTYENKIKEIIDKEELTPAQVNAINSTKTAVLWTIIDRISSLN